MDKFEDYKLIGKISNHDFFQNDNTLVLVARSSMAGGGVVIREDAYNKLKKYKDTHDCRVLLENLTTEWKWEGPLSDLPEKPVMTFNSGTRGWIFDQSDLGVDFEPF